MNISLCQLLSSTQRAWWRQARHTSLAASFKCQYCLHEKRVVISIKTDRNGWKQFCNHGIWLHTLLHQLSLQVTVVAQSSVESHAQCTHYVSALCETNELNDLRLPVHDNFWRTVKKLTALHCLHVSSHTATPRSQMYMMLKWKT